MKSVHKQLRDIDKKQKARKALEDVQRASIPVPAKPVAKVAAKKPKSVLVYDGFPCEPGANHFCGSGKKNKLPKKYKTISSAKKS